MKALLKRREAYAQMHRLRRMRHRVVSLGLSAALLCSVSVAAAGLTNTTRHDVKRPADTNPTLKNGNSLGSSKKVPPEPSIITPQAPAIKPDTPVETIPMTVNPCTQPKTPSLLASSSDTQLQKLAEYESVMCGASVASSMIFTDFPSTNVQADERATYIAAKLTAFAAVKITPYVIIEPQTNGTNLDLATLRDSTTTSVFEYFLTSLKAKGITDAEVGTWVFFPEPNLLEWSTVDPAVFTTNFTSFGTLFKEYFKAGRLSVMLDSTTYTINDYSAAGSYASLLPYISGLPAGLVDSFGFQGFPWAAPANTSDSSTTNPKDFLKLSLVQEAASVLGVRDVWLNSGTYAKYYAGNSSKEVRNTALDRAKILDSIAGQVAALQKSGLNVSFNLFAQDKSAALEGVDWSYWQAGKAAHTDGAAIIGTFADKLKAQGVGIGVYDAY